MLGSAAPLERANFMLMRKAPQSPRGTGQAAITSNGRRTTCSVRRGIVLPHVGTSMAHLPRTQGIPDHHE